MQAITAWLVRSRPNLVIWGRSIISICVSSQSLLLYIVKCGKTIQLRNFCFLFWYIGGYTVGTQVGKRFISGSIPTELGNLKAWKYVVFGKFSYTYLGIHREWNNQMIWPSEKIPFFFLKRAMGLLVVYHLNLVNSSHLRRCGWVSL